MKLVGIAYVNADKPLSDGYLRLGPSTVVVGQNDTGKSRLLKLVEAALAGHAPVRSPHGGRKAAATLFVSCSRAALDGLYKDVLRQPSGPLADDAQPVAGDRWWWGRLPAEEPPGTRPDGDLRTWLDRFAAAQKQAHSAWQRLLEAAVGSSDEHRCILAVEADYAEHEELVWNVMLASRPIADLPGELQAALSEVGVCLDPEVAGRLSHPAVPRDLCSLSGLDRSGRSLAQRTLAEAPVVLAPLGRTGRSLCPKPLVVPRSYDQVAGEVEGALIQATGVARQAEKVLDDAYTALEDLGEPDPGHEDSWSVETSDHGVALSPAAVALTRTLEGTANLLLPDWISKIYEVAVEHARPTDWGARGRLTLALRRHAVGSEDRLPIGDAADGLHLWLQLSLLEAAELVHVLASLTDAAIGVAADAFDSASELECYSGVESETTDTEVIEAWRLFHEKRRHLQELVQLALTGKPLEPEELWPLRGSSWGSALARGRVFVIDEPEQHLHPRREREVADWLVSLPERSVSSTIIATHSPPFMGSQGACLAYMWRPVDGPARVRAVPPGRLVPMDEIATDLGLDRGHLMTHFDTYLFVEGEFDRSVLEGLCGPELHSARVCVVPTRGADRARAILDAGLLSRYTSARLAIWLDNVSPSVLDTIRSGVDDAQRIFNDKKATKEERIVASIYLEAAEAGREDAVESLPHPGQDTFDLLSDAALEAIEARWPGHEAARARAAASGRHWKKFYAEEFGLPPTSETARSAAALMRAQGDFPQAIRDLVLRLGGPTMRLPDSRAKNEGADSH